VAKAWLRPDRMFAAVSCSRRPGKTVGDLVMGGKEALDLPRRLEPLHDPLSFGPALGSRRGDLSQTRHLAALAAEARLGLGQRRAHRRQLPAATRPDPGRTSRAVGNASGEGSEAPRDRKGADHSSDADQRLIGHGA
jgi:hypothetical protein